MAKAPRKILAVNIDTGEKKVYETAMSLAAELKVSIRSVMQAVERNGVCREWRLYDTPERIKAQIEVLEKRLKVVEEL